LLTMKRCEIKILRGRNSNETAMLAYLRRSRVENQLGVRPHLFYCGETTIYIHYWSLER